ncbi:MAG: hypothetical protein AB8G96_11565 [Phycisphaerales bacterium]
MDQRLEEVRQSEVAESRVNEDFVAWLKSTGLNIFLVIMLAILAYLMFIRWQDSRKAGTVQAWTTYYDAATPNALEDVATDPKVSGVARLPVLARLRAADQLIGAMIAGREIQEGISADANPPAPPRLDEAGKVEYRDRADRLFAAVVTDDDNSDGMALHAWRALMGRASVAESRGDLSEAADFYAQASDRAKDVFPGLARRSDARVASLDQFSEPTPLADAAPGGVGTPGMPRPAAARSTPVSVDPILEAIIDPSSADDGS